MDLNLYNFDSISLSQMEDIRLMKRVDMKFVAPLCLLPEILDELPPDYYVQEINCKRSFSYATLYYDTCDYEMFRAHQNGKLNRMKVRTREYVDSDLCFLEVKQKSNKGMTSKIRIPNPTLGDIRENGSSLFLSSNTPYCPASLEAKLLTNYERVTLVNKAKTERLTVDYSLRFRNARTDRTISLPEIAIFEVKKERASFSPVMDSLNRLRIKPKGMSKYCMGVSLTESPSSVKINTFKAKVLNINKITPFQHE